MAWGGGPWQHAPISFRQIGFVVIGDGGRTEEAYTVGIHAKHGRESP